MIGSTVADALLARGDEVVGLTRNPDAARSANPRVRWHRWDPALERPPAEALEGVDGVLNLLGESINQRLTDAAKKRIVESRETATRNLVAAIAAADQRPAVMVSQSAVGYYGDRGDEIVDESSEPGEGFAAEVPIAWEAAAREVEKTGVRLVVVRTAPVLDRRGGLLKRLMLPFKLGLGGPIAGGDQYLPWVHIDDEVGILLWALDNEKVSRGRQRVGARAGHQPRVLEGARPRPSPAGGVPVAEVCAERRRGKRAGRHDRGRPARRPAADDRARIRVPLPAPRARDARGARLTQPARLRGRGLREGRRSSSPRLPW